MNQTNIMIDLETMDTAHTAAIVAIGAVAFDPEHGVDIGSAFYRTVELQSCIDHGLTVSGSTVRWWLRQSQDARQSILTEQARIHTVLNDFSRWVIAQCDGDTDRAVVWGNGSDFDNVILTNAYRALKFSDRPWGPFNDRCYRTLKNLRRDIKLERTGTHHNALDDAISQAEHAVRLLNAIKQEAGHK